MRDDRGIAARFPQDYRFDGMCPAIRILALVSNLLSQLRKIHAATLCLLVGRRCPIVWPLQCSRAGEYRLGLRFDGVPWMPIVV